MAKRAFHQVILIFEVPRDPPPLDLSFESIVVDDPTCTTGYFDAYVDTHWDYAT